MLLMRRMRLTPLTPLTPHTPPILRTRLIRRTLLGLYECPVRTR